jgi:hypothetical protein
VNRGIAETTGDVVGVMIDGARIASPGLLHFGLHGAGLYAGAIVATLGWYLGFDFQRYAMQSGYVQAREDALLASIDWPRDGYRLFEIATMDESSVEGWFFPVSESNALFMRRQTWARLGGVEERFDAPGGGLLNLDTFSRAMALPDARLVIPLGEGTFHQLHGGVATNRPIEDIIRKFREWDDQHEQIRGYRSHRMEPQTPTYIGALPRAALLHFVRAAVAPVRGPSEFTLGNFDRELWSLHLAKGLKDPVNEALIELLQKQFKAGQYAATVSIARLIRARSPEESEPQRLLALIAGGLDYGYPLRREYYFALSEAYRLIGDNEMAASHYQTALTLNGS